MKHILLSTVAAIALAACSSQDTGSGYSGSGSGMRSSFYPGGAAAVVYQHIDDSFNYQDIGLDSRGKSIPVAVGSGSAAAHPQLTASVAQEIQGATWGVPLSFVPASGRELAQANIDPNRDRMASPFSVVMMFDAPRDVTGAQLCAEPSVLDAPAAASMSGGGITLLTALCRYDKAVSQTTAAAPGIRGFDDPAVGDLVLASVRELTNPMSTTRTDTIKYDD